MWISTTRPFLSEFMTIWNTGSSWIKFKNMFRILSSWTMMNHFQYTVTFKIALFKFLPSNLPPKLSWLFKNNNGNNLNCVVDKFNTIYFKWTCRNENYHTTGSFISQTCSSFYSTDVKFEFKEYFWLWVISFVVIATCSTGH